MADIKTIFRELSVILGFILSKYELSWNGKDVITFVDLIKKYCINIDECESELKKLIALNDIADFQDIIQNGIKLGNLLYEKFKFEGDIRWVGSQVKAKYPFDIKIGESGISLKEDSYILKNPSFANYLNALLQPKTKFKTIHVFRRFAPDLFNKWFEYTYNKLIHVSESHKVNDIIFEYSKRGTFIKKEVNGLIFGSNNGEIEITFTDTVSEAILNSKLGGFIFEHTFSKWIKEYLEKKDNIYEQLKKDCSIEAGRNLKEYISKNLDINSKEILELLQIYDKSYYYGKSHGEPHLYKVPSNKEFNVKLIDIEIKVPESQLNVYFTFEISNKNASNSTKFRVECRYSHGQFKGIPEAKLYYTDAVNHLKNLYEFIN